MRPDGRLGTASAGLIGLGLGLLALGPGIRPGYLLTYDMVFVPQPPFNAAMFGVGGTLPRAVPSDAVAASLAHVLPADLVQKLLLLSIFVLACAGVAELLAREPYPARIAAGICFAWNPYVAERLIIGQWPSLLGYAGLPWVVVALTRPAPAQWRRAGRLALALVPAAIGGFVAMCFSGLVVIAISATAAGMTARQRLRGIVLSLGVLATLSLPWLIPSLTRTVHTSPAGVAAFAARADTPFGAFGSLVLLGGAWNGQTVPFGYGGVLSWLWFAVVIAALAGFACFGWNRWPGVGIAAVAGLMIASIGITGPGRDVLREMIAAWPGFAVLRDGQQFVAPLALAESLGLGLAARWALSRNWRAPVRDLRWLPAVLAILAPIVLLPGLAWGAAGRLSSVQYPADWLAARSVIDRDRAPGRVLLLPWAAYRRFGWNAKEAVLDPWPRLLARQVIWNDAVTVGSITVPAEDPLARKLASAITSGTSLTSELVANHVRYVIVDAPEGPGGGRSSAAPGAYPDSNRLPGCTVVVAGPGLVVYRVPAGGRPGAG